VQALLSVGDRRVGGLLERVLELEGNWSQALRTHPLNPDFYVYRQKSYHELLAWDHIVSGLPKEKLIAQREQAYALAPTPTVA
jgi:hypothetical protein